MSWKLVQVRFDKKDMKEKDYWIENEADGVDQSCRVTRGPFTLRGAGPYYLFMENKNDDDVVMEKGTMIGVIEKATFKSSSHEINTISKEEEKPSTNKPLNKPENNPNKSTNSMLTRYSKSWE